MLRTARTTIAALVFLSVANAYAEPEKRFEMWSELLKFKYDLVVVQSDAGPSSIVENGLSHSFKSAPAAFSWHPAGSEISIANRSNQTTEFVLIEVKQ